MSLNAILAAVRTSGEMQVQEIEERTQSQVTEILTRTRLAAEQAQDETRLKEIAPAYRERAHIIHRARLESLRITGGVRESLINTAINQARGRISSLRGDPGYPEVLRRLTQEALSKLEGSLEDVSLSRLECDLRDRVLMERILQEMGLNLQVSYNLDCWGGLIARSDDGRVAVINTLETRLERATPFLRRCLAALFEEEQGESQPERQMQLAEV